MADKVPNYTPAQEQLILDAVRANGNVGNLEIATTLAANPAMNGPDGPRKPRNITSKMARMKVEHGFTYQGVARTTKDGKPVQKKLDLVARIAAAVGETVAKLDGLEKAPKAALDILVGFVESVPEVGFEQESEAA